MEFRPLNVNDAADWWNLRLEALETEPMAFGASPEEHKTMAVEEVAARIGSMPEGSFYLGGFDAGKLVAMATFVREKNIKERHKGHIYAVYVAASHRGRGLGRRLLQELINRLKHDPTIEQVLIGANAQNTVALRTYQSVGFEIYGTEPRSLKVGQEVVDEHLMVLMLRP